MIVAALAGLALGIGSATHCAAMCGPLSALACRHARPRSWLHYLGGRLISYSLMGALLGSMSASALAVVRAPWIGALASWTLALSMALAAYWLWNGAPRGASALVSLRVPGRTRSLLTKFTARLSAWPPALVGASQALLPCGALAAAGLVAAGQGTPRGGAAAMAGFAAASSVGLLLPGLAGRLVVGLRRNLALRGFAVVLAVCAAWMVVRPMSALRAPRGEQADSCPIHGAHGGAGDGTGNSEPEE